MFIVGNLRFTWDERKAKTNQRKHGVSFEEAASVFADTMAVIMDDVEHSDDETREAIIGHSSTDRLLIASFTVRESVIRLISARVVTRNERKDYEEGRLF